MKHKLFFCYSNVNTSDANGLIAELEAEFLVWSDRSVKPGQDIWDEQLTSIENCDAMLFLLTSASLESELIRQQLNYAWRINCPIVPIVVKWVISDQIQISKESLDEPREIAENQKLYYIKNQLTDDINKSFAAFKNEKSGKYRRLRLPRPERPGDEDTETLFNLAEQAARSLDFDRAASLFKKLSKNPDLRTFAEDWQVIIASYKRVYKSDQQRYTQKRYKSDQQRRTQEKNQLADDIIYTVNNSLTFRRWQEYLDNYPEKMPLFDPLKYKKRAEAWKTVSGEDIDSETGQQVPRFLPTKPLRMSDTISILPEPFSWIDVPEQRTERRGPMRLLGNENVKPGYKIAKYPITVSQFAKFLKHEAGYDVVSWWTFNAEASFWRIRQDKQKALKQMHPESPRTFVTWYDAMAFCNWLSEQVGGRITLPTVEQWEYAANQGDERAYPWGDYWDGNRCNNNVNPFKSNGVSQVTRYDGIGESPFGVSDMVGNVWEWCMDKDSKIGNEVASTRSMRGGSSNSTDSGMYVIKAKNSLPADKALPNVGFRIVMYSS